MKEDGRGDGIQAKDSYARIFVQKEFKPLVEMHADNPIVFHLSSSVFICGFFSLVPRELPL